MLWKHTPFDTNQRRKPGLEFFPLKECKRAFIVHTKHFTCIVKLIRSPYLRVLMFPFIKKKIEDKQESRSRIYTYNLIEAKIFMEATKWKKREDRHYQMISSREFLPYVPLCFLSSFGKSIDNVFVFCLLVRKSTMRRSVFRQLHI